MKTKNSQHVVVFRGSSWEADLILGLLKSNGVLSAVKFNREDSAYKDIFNTEDEIFVNQLEADKAKDIIANSTENKLNNIE